VIRLYDTARREKVALQPIEVGRLGVYVCGPTVYDMCHVGHARCYVAFDVVIRHLRASGFAVRYVRNITDVDDKIIKRAAEAGGDPLELSAHMAEEFHRDMQALGNLRPDVEPKVSEHIGDIVALTERILQSGHAYAVGGDVYFEVGAFPAYGGLSKRNVDELRAGARVEVDERKRNPLDFALWKAAKPGEPSWDSPWGKGRPGWHIECSAMSSRYLGDRFDIHGGGMDLIFPHHENELAQSRSIAGPESFAQAWMHNGFITVRTADNVEEKMSKSLGNFFTIRQVAERYEPEALRLFLLGTHYRSPIAFEVDATATGEPRFVSLEEAERRLSYSYGTRARLQAALAVGKPQSGVGRPEGPKGEGAVMPEAGEFAARFQAAMDDDFNTAAALGHVAELLTFANKLLDQPSLCAKDVRRRTLQTIDAGLQRVAEVLGVFAEEPQAFLARRRTRLAALRGIDPAEVDRRIGERDASRKAKDFASADRIRTELAAGGVELMDGAGGTTWRISEEPPK
jgi:cysteinyl-tRNA synthetase